MSPFISSSSVALLTTIKAVVFDMDGLLLDSESLAVEALVSAGKVYNFDLPLSFCHLLIGTTLETGQQLIEEHYGPDFPIEAYCSTYENHFRALIHEGRLSLKPGVMGLLDYLHQQKIQCAVATSSGRKKTEEHLTQQAIKNYFSYIVTREDIVHGKPAPDPYLKAAELLGVRPEVCLALEDSYNGIRSAYSAGMNVIMVPDLLAPNEEMYHKTIAVLPDLDQVRKTLQAEKK